MGLYTTTPLFPKAPTYRESPGVSTKTLRCLQAAERTGSPFQPWLRTDDLYPATTVALHLGERTFIMYQSRGFSTHSSDNNIPGL